MARRLPAEWEPQAGTLLSWPHPESDWGPHLEQAESSYLALAGALARCQPLHILHRDDAHRRRIEGRLFRAGLLSPDLHFHPVPCDDTWVRDYGPVTVLEDHRPRLLDFRFRGWGGKYPAERDDRATAALHRAGAFGDTPLERHDLELEGGSIDSDGAGTLLTTRRCLLARNPGMDEAAYEAFLGDALGVRRVLWLTEGALTGDDTDGHVDMLARFCSPRTVAYAASAGPEDPDHRALQALERELEGLRDAQGNPYRLNPLPRPRPIHGPDGEPLPASYANFLVLNEAVLVPFYDDPADAVARGRIQACFPGRETFGIPCRGLILQYGSLHCATMHLPRGAG
jgi:agmatine/peptidylarginine deiminase